MRWWNRISIKLALVIILMAVVPLGTFGLFSITKIRSALLESVSQTNFAAAHKAASTIEANVHETIKNFRIILDNSDFENQDHYDREWQLQLLVKNFPEISAISLFNVAGTPVLKVTQEDTFIPENIERRKDIEQALEDLASQTIVGRVSRDKEGLLILPIDLLFAGLVSHQSSFAVTLEINMSRMLEAVSDQHLSNDGYLYVLDEAGDMVLYPDRSVVLAGEKALYNPNVDLFIKGKKIPQFSRQHMNRENIPVVSNAYVTEQPRLLAVVEQPLSEALSSANLIFKYQWLFMIGILLISIVFSIYFVLKLSRPIKRLEQGVEKIGKGDLDASIPIVTQDEIGTVSHAFNQMANRLKAAKRRDSDLLWIEQGLTKLETFLAREQGFEESNDNVIVFLCEYIKSHIGLMYCYRNGGVFDLMAGYAIPRGYRAQEQLKLGEGLVGQCAVEKRIKYLEDLPDKFFTVSSSLGEMPPKQSVIIPLVFNDVVQGVIEIGSLKTFSARDKTFLQEAAERIGVALSTIRSRDELNTLLTQTKNQKKELELQQGELQAANEELEEQTQRLLASEGELRNNQEELQAANEELEEKTEFLERHRLQLEEKNQDLEMMQTKLTKKAEDLALSSKYKSEFLANMSHELRTPLNSLLLLSQILAENKEANLNEDQVESARVIFSSGSELLLLINEILDLSKIEAGKMELNICEIEINDLSQNIVETFTHLAQQKNLDFEVTVAPNTQSTIVSDFERIKQILKNLISNAIKFTSRGGIHIHFAKPASGQTYLRKELNGVEVLAISIKDTGIGVAPEKHSMIFEAFQQSEGGISRKYGGTGLGLSICRELSKLLNGEIHMDSSEGKGATFTLYLPTNFANNLPTDITKSEEDTSSATRVEISPDPLPRTMQHVDTLEAPEQHVPDDREKLDGETKSILIIEDDLAFGKSLLHFCRERGFNCLYSATGENGLVLVHRYNPDAILLDIKLPGMDGLSVFDALKADDSTSNIPVHFMSIEEPLSNVFERGAVGYLKKPVSSERVKQTLDKIEEVITQKVKSLLVVEDNLEQQKSIGNLLKGQDIVINTVGSGEAALSTVRENVYDCIILDLDLPDITGFELLERLKNEPDIPLPPVIVYTGRDLSFEEEDSLRNYSESIIIKGVKSEQRLLDETALFLHRMETGVSVSDKKMTADINDSDQMFATKTILLVDDDMRNVFALSKVLTARKMTVLKAENGQKAVDIVKATPNIDLVLMDIMMPVMDGYEAIKEIREDTRFATLPIIALTAKAMKQDRDDCISAGANDYLTKPVDVERLLSMMRVWLYD